MCALDSPEPQPEPQLSVAPPASPLATYTNDPSVLQSRVDMFSPMYGEPEMCTAPSEQPPPALAPQPPATGLASYQVVPDDFVGPLAPNQIRQAQYNDLHQYNFDQFNVVPDDFVGPLMPTQMRQAEYQQLQQSWLNIADGRGMSITGQQGDRDAFRRMMRDGMTDSPVFRNLISGIGNDADPAHLIQARVGRNQPNVIIDNFGTKEIGIDDLEQFPTTPDKMHPDEMTRPELIAHFLRERQYNLQNGGSFDPAHQAGIDLQNQYRDERRQSHVVDQVFRSDAAGNPVINPDGTMNGDTRFANGKVETTQFDNNSNIRQLVRP